MKLAVFSLLISTLVSVASANSIEPSAQDAPPECYNTEYKSDIAFIEAALGKLVLMPGETLTSVTFERTGYRTGKGTVTGNGETTEFRSKFNCKTQVIQTEFVRETNAPKFVCQKDYINCMPPLFGAEAEKYCSREFYDWSVANCGGAPLIAN